jgi:uncharacterized protein YjiS (DUF1127 family)
MQHGDERSAYRVTVRKLEGKRPFRLYDIGVTRKDSVCLGIKVF